MAPFFANRSCDPFTPESTPCTLGNYVNYAVNVSEPADISKTLAFAKDHNIRVIIRNTGHECGPSLAPPPSPKAPPYAKKLTYPPVPSYLGRSTGAGSIAIWTHHLKTITLTTHSSTAYHGPGIRLGAGVQAFEAYAFASAHNLAVVGGECPTVGLAGGYTQGGGHSLLASKYGLAADQTLEWEVIDGRGNLLTATPTHNADLYWALSGGGAGTYAVVWSLTIKAHADTPTSAANLTFANTNPKAFYQAVAAYHAQLLPPLVDAGATSIAVVTNASFALGPIIAPDVSAARLQSLLRPFTDTLDALGIEYKPTVRQFPTYLSAFEATMFPVGVGVAQYGGRLIPRSVVRQDNDALTAALRRIVEDGAAVVGVGLNVAKAVDNAVLPAWREALVHAVVFTYVPSLDLHL